MNKLINLRLVSTSPDAVPSFLVRETNGTKPEKRYMFKKIVMCDALPTLILVVRALYLMLA